MGRTFSHLNARVRQHVPLHLLSSQGKELRPKRGRPAKRNNGHDGQHEHHPTATNHLPPRRSQRLTAKSASAVTPTDTLPPDACPAPTPIVSTSDITPDVTKSDNTTNKYQSAIATHLYENVGCAEV